MKTECQKSYELYCKATKYLFDTII